MCQGLVKHTSSYLSIHRNSYREVIQLFVCLFSKRISTSYCPNKFSCLYFITIRKGNYFLTACPKPMELPSGTSAGYLTTVYQGQYPLFTLHRCSKTKENQIMREQHTILTRSKATSVKITKKIKRNLPETRRPYFSVMHTIMPIICL